MEQRVREQQQQLDKLAQENDLLKKTFLKLFWKEETLSREKRALDEQLRKCRDSKQWWLEQLALIEGDCEPWPES